MTQAHLSKLDDTSAKPSRLHFTLKAKLTVLFTLLVALISIYISVSFPRRFETQATKALAAKLRSIGEMTAFTVSSGLLFEDQEAVNAALEGAKQNRDLAYIVVSDTSGTVFSSYNLAEADRVVYRQIQNILDLSPDGTVYKAKLPVVYEAQVIGDLYLGLSLEELKNQVHQSRTGIALTSFAIFAIGVLAVFIISTFIVAPLKQMVATLGRIEQGDLSQRMGVVSQDEAGHLAHSFNQMLDKVEARTEALQHEVTQRGKAEKAMRAAQSRLQELLTSSPAVLYSCARDQPYQVTFISDNVERLLGYKPEAMLNNPDFWFQCVHLEDLPQLKGQEVPKNRDRGSTHEYRFQTQKGDYHWIRDQKKMVFDDTGQALEIVGTLMDITEQKQTEAQLQQAQRMESIGQLAAGVAHEINTPMQFVGDCSHFLGDAFTTLKDVLEQSQRLLEEGRTEELTQTFSTSLTDEDLPFILNRIPIALRDISEGIQRVRQIVAAMKDFSHPGTGVKELADINQIIEKAAMVSRNEWKYVADLDLHLDPALPPIPCLVSDLSRVLINLVVNAAHAIAAVKKEHSAEKGIITIRTHLDGDRLELRVSDTGTGIPQAAQPHVFVPFFTTKEVGKGTGQGLAIAHDVVVSQHGGEITFETEQNKGTTFFVRLPLVDQTNQLQTEEAA